MYIDSSLGKTMLAICECSNKYTADPRSEDPHDQESRIERWGDSLCPVEPCHLLDESLLGSNP